MAEPLSPESFATLLAQTGVKLPPAEAEDLRHAHAKLMTMLAMLRDPAVPLSAEPAFTFDAGESA
jgi:hypothetical protein